MHSYMLLTRSPGLFHSEKKLLRARKVIQSREGFLDRSWSQNFYFLAKDEANEEGL